MKIKPIILLVLSLLLLLPTVSFASNDQVITTSNKTSITIKKGQGDQEQKKIISLKFKTDSVEVEKNTTGYLPLFAEYSDGSREFVGEFAEYQSSNSKVIEVIDKYGVSGISLGTAQLTAKYEGLKAYIEVKVVEEITPDVTVLIDDQESISLQELNYKYDDNKYYYTTMSIRSQYDNGKLKLYGIDWDVEGPYYGFIVGKNKIYKITIDADDRGKEIYTDDVQYTEVSISNAIKEGLKYNRIYLEYYLNAKDPEILAYMEFDEIVESFFIPEGTYNIQILAYDEHSIYQLLSLKTEINQDHQQLVLDDSELVKVEFDGQIDKGYEFPVLSLCNFDYFTTCSPLYGDYRKVNKIFTTKLDYDIRFSVSVDKIRYEFEIDEVDLTNNIKIDFDNNIQAQLNIADQVYEGNSNLYLYRGDSELTIEDSYGNKLTVRDDNGEVKGYLVFENENEKYISEITSLSKPTVKLPNIEGTFDVYFVLSDVEDDY
ncbi:hypothetical protein [Bacillus solimangrovi]|uniref:BIG2 domain-containing protein n=1 Tax=Bacillus solimangrovi TaxID=1305675 RepID=A0A1E5LHQ5_9BACI|nr:hypothetical protein [Bacillus solimangrovi]OEH93619.1 hypothetical protein BFG57_01135 [Bacillus solimangrovi]